MSLGISKGRNPNALLLANEPARLIGLSALWPVLALSLALLAGCKSTSRVAEVRDPFLPTKTVSVSAAQRLPLQVALK